MFLNKSSDHSVRLKMYLNDSHFFFLMLFIINITIYELHYNA